MDKENSLELERLSLEINLELNIIYNALKYDDEELDMVAIGHVISNIYEKSKKVMKLF